MYVNFDNVVMGAGFRVLGAGCWVLGASYWLLVFLGYCIPLTPGPLFPRLRSGQAPGERGKGGWGDKGV